MDFHTHLHSSYPKSAIRKSKKNKASRRDIIIKTRLAIKMVRAIFLDLRLSFLYSTIIAMILLATKPARDTMEIAGMALLNANNARDTPKTITARRASLLGDSPSDASIRICFLSVLMARNCLKSPGFVILMDFSAQSGLAVFEREKALESGTLARISKVKPIRKKLSRNNCATYFMANLKG